MVKHSKKRQFVTALLIGILLFVSILLLGATLAIYLPGLNLNDWLKNTAHYWLIWRFGLYGVVVILIYQIRRYYFLPKKLVWLLILALILIEGMNALYRL